MIEQNKNGSIFIRLEGPEDRDAVREINLAAFPAAGEADLVERLRVNCDQFISLVAELEGSVIGQILFTPMTLAADDGRTLMGMGLAPLAVRPSYQNKGVGTSLVKAGLGQMQAEGTPFVVVLGHPDYYPRFGFETAARFGLRCAYPNVPEEAFMVRVLDQEALSGITGVMHYHPAFDAVS